MKLRTIWTLPACTLREKISRTGEWAIAAIAHRVPKRLAYWVLIDQGVRHIRSDETVPDVPFTVILDRAGRP